jgi:hypothetical protein
MGQRSGEYLCSAHEDPSSVLYEAANFKKKISYYSTVSRYNFLQSILMMSYDRLKTHGRTYIYDCAWISFGVHYLLACSIPVQVLV